MNKFGNRLVLALVASSLWSTFAGAAAVQSPDEVCAPAANPCLVGGMVEVDADFPLDFGLRTVRVLGAGNFQGTLDLRCGAFESQTTGVWMQVLPATDPGEVTITARRHCSLDASRACLSDTACAVADAGTCSGGDGGIRIAGQLTGNSSQIVLRAAGDVAIEGRLTAPGRPPIANGGNIRVETTFGSIETAALIDVIAGTDPDYGGPGLGGSVTLRAAQDVTLRGQIVATGGFAEIEVDAGRDVVALASILAQGRNGADHVGGTIDLWAARDLRVVREPGLVAPRFNITGGQEEYNGDYGYGYVSGGPGGYGFFRAGRELVVGERVRMLGDSGDSVGFPDTSPISGDWYFEAEENASFDAALTARAWGRYGFGSHGVSIYGGDAVRVGRKAQIATNASYSGSVAVVSTNRGPVSIDGRVNVTGRKIKEDYGYTHGTGGDVWVDGGDVSIGGRFFNGGPTRSGNMSFRGCRLRLKSGAKIDGGKGIQQDGPVGSSFYARESMVTEASTTVRARPGAVHRIEYRDAAKVPSLAGRMTPAPALVVNPLLGGCPVCGNLEIDESETCDDGNLTSGDGCDALCSIEP